MEFRNRLNLDSEGSVRINSELTIINGLVSGSEEGDPVCAKQLIPSKKIH
jgi:hypothetical protein